jgi:hypothetical protein
MLLLLLATVYYLVVGGPVKVAGRVPVRRAAGRKTVKYQAMIWPILL